MSYHFSESKVVVLARAAYLSPEDFEVVYRLLMPQNALIMRVCVHTGLRISDVLAFRADKVSRQFWITEKKTRKRRRVNLTSSLLQEILVQSGRRWCFESRCDWRKPKSRQAVWKDVKRAAVAMRLDVNLSTHSARKAFAVDLYKRSGDLDRVCRALNHSDRATTMIYAMADLARARKRYSGA